MRSRLSQYPDMVFLVAIIGLFILLGGALLLRSHFSQEDWQTNFERASIPLDDVVVGGQRDSIQPIDRPHFQSVQQAQSWLVDYAPVIVVLIEDEARAYPLNVLLRHEIVNDQINEVYLAITFCPLCNSAVVYDREVDQQVLRFGVTGTLYSNNFIMWDDQTESWWQQASGEAVAGKYMGYSLRIIPHQIVGFSTFSRRFPGGLVLAGDGKKSTDQYSVYPYVGYDSKPAPMMSEGSFDPRLPAMERVLGALVDEVPVAYAYSLLEEAGVYPDEINGNALIAFWQPGAISILDGITAQTSHNIGQTALFYAQLDEEILHFRYQDGHIFDRETGSEWNIFGEAVSGVYEGQRLEQIQTFSYFWFAWSMSYPDTLIHTR